MLDESLYDGREQTRIKHEILNSYLERFAHIIGSRWRSITYIDCFSGPWQQQSESFEDTSFGIALRQLRSAREHLKSRRYGNFQIRCYFLEKNEEAYARLKEYTRGISDVEIRTRNESFEDSVEDIVEFIDGDKGTFPFTFIDPTGWNGVAIESIRPLLKRDPGEIMVNFMTSHVKRFVEHRGEGNRESFKRLYGTDEYLSLISEVDEPMDREDVIVDLYCKQIGLEGDYPYVSKAIVLHPDRDSTHYHLVYATRHPKGLEVFKMVEEKAMKLMEEKRKSNVHVEEDPNLPLFDTDEYDSSPPTHYEFLRSRYLESAYSNVCNLLNCHSDVPYDEIWAETVRHPLSWKSDLKGWIQRWKDAELIEIVGMEGRQSVPRIGQGVTLRVRSGVTL